MKILFYDTKTTTRSPLTPPFFFSVHRDRIHKVRPGSQDRRPRGRVRRGLRLCQFRRGRQNPGHPAQQRHPTDPDAMRRL